MLDVTQYQRIVVDRYRFRGFHGCDAWCALEILRINDSKRHHISPEGIILPGALAALLLTADVRVAAVLRDAENQNKRIS